MNRWACVARMGGIGDNLMAATVLAPLKKMGYMVEVISAEPNHVVFHHNPHIDKLSVKIPDIDLPKNDLPNWQKWFQSRAREYDVFVHASHSCEGRHSMFPTMTAFWWPQDYRRKLCGGNFLETVHDIAGTPYEFGPLYYASEEEKARALETKEKIGPACIGWVLCGSRIDKIYPYTAMAIARIIKELKIPVVMFGAPIEKEFNMAKTIQDHVALTNGSVDGLHLAMSTNTAEPGGEQFWHIRRALAQVLACDLIVTPDTGPAWAAAFYPMPKICMVSHASAENITKHWVNTVTLHADPIRVPCWPCHRLHESQDTCVPNKEDNGAACISDISVETLLGKVEALWSARRDNIVHAENIFSKVGRNK